MWAMQALQALQGPLRTESRDPETAGGVSNGTGLGELASPCEL